MERSEAIEVIKKNYPYVSESGTQFETALRTLIPELKESDDERIRNFLIGKFREIGEVWHEYSTKDIIAWLEKQGSQNLANSEKTCKVEPNPAWNEEDEKVLGFILNDLLYLFINLNAKSTSQYNIETKWLKSLKERIQPQPKQEWSEEDEDMVDNIIKAIQHLLKQNDSWNFLEDCLEWLKSLKYKKQTYGM